MAWLKVGVWRDADGSRSHIRIINAAQAAMTNRIAGATSNCGMNGQRCAGDKELLTVRLRQSCGLVGFVGATTVFPPGNSPRLCGEHWRIGTCDMMRWMLGAVMSLSVICPALANNLDATAVNDAVRPAKQPATDKISASVAKLQIMLDRARFSPGEIDGKFCENAQKALKAFAEQSGIAFEKT